MPWCPKCKNEYVEGIKRCKKCDCSLVEQLIRKEDSIAKGAPTQLQSIVDLLHQNNISSARVQYDEGEEIHYLLVDPEERDAAANVVSEIARMENQMRYQKMRSVGGGSNNGSNEIYQNKMEQAQEVKSSAYALIIVGIVGSVFNILYIFNVIPIRWSTFTKTVTCSVMGVLFLALIIMGFLSVKSFKSLLSFAKEEDKMTGEIEKWYQKELTSEQIDAMLEGRMEPNLPEEEKYFYRIEQIRHVLTEKFMNLNPAYADNMTEKIYQELYEHEA
ncbi:MAG: hypothetical protein K2J95_01640 [Lachnospiraceae bacterium]|nr:hypothetical protein [Lachnospiraceae bacterium]